MFRSLRQTAAAARFLRRAAFLAGAGFLSLSAAHAMAQDFLPAQVPPWTQSQSTTRIAMDRFDDGAETPGTHPASAKRNPHAAPMTPDEYAPLLADLVAQDSQIAQMIGAAAQPVSAIEDSYSRRVTDPLTQFGYDVFQQRRTTDGESPSLPAGAVQDHFVLSIGDKLNVTIRGQKNETGIHAIASDGTLILPDMPPIPAAGQTIGQLREHIRAANFGLYNTDFYIALDSVRQVNILVVGNVGEPGRKTLTVFHTVLDALMQSGGIDKGGSLRQIKLVRDGRTTMVDLYGLLVYGSSGMDITLRDGDRLIVPPIGPTIAVAGGVKRPGIYEILPSLRGMRHKPENASQSLSMQEALDLAGGLVSPGNNRFMKMGLGKDGREVVTDLSDSFAPIMNDGSILMVARADDKRAETVELAGHTRQPGLHPLSKSGSLSALFHDKNIFGPDIYPLIGVIERWDDSQMARVLEDFPPLLVAQGHYDAPLQDGDIVHLFSRRQIQDLQKPHNLAPEQIEPAAGSMDNDDGDTITGDPVLSKFVAEHTVYVRGAVREGGAWPVATGATLDSVLASAGGLSLEGDPGAIEVTTTTKDAATGADIRNGRMNIDINTTDAKTVALNPGDSVRVNQKFKKAEGQSVAIIGEIAHPGKYDLAPGDTLGSLLRRAGGLSAQAYPDGAIFSRNSERKAEEERFRAAARELDRSLATAMQKEKDRPDANQIAMAQDLSAELRHIEAVGRITVEADPAILNAQPELDILLEPGDRIYIPSRPLTVRVAGEILSPAALQFRTEKDARDYIGEAGGPTYFADMDRAFVLYPDGSAQPLLVSAWNHKSSFIPPGSTIVVPRDPKPFDFIESAKDISQILSNLAITGIFLRDIQDDDD